MRAVEGQVSAGELAALQEPVRELELKYRQLCDGLAERCQQLETALVQSQGVQDALDGLLAWLNSAENTFKYVNVKFKLFFLIIETIDNMFYSCKAH